MTRWYDCPVCIGYCEEYLDEDGGNVCPSCGSEVWFEPAPPELKQQLYKEGIWTEEIVCIQDEDEVATNPAFEDQDQYDKWIEWNVIRIRAACGQLDALLSEDDDSSECDS